MGQPGAGPGSRQLVVALVVADGDRARIASALASRAPAVHVTFCERVEVAYALVQRRGVRVVIVQPTDAKGRDTAPLVRAVRSTRPSVALLAYCATRPGLSARVLELARAGVHELVLVGVDDVGPALLAALETARMRAGTDVILSLLAPALPPAAAEIVEYFLHAAPGSSLVDDAAAAFGVHRRTLVNRLARAHLPGPREVAGWCRLLLALVMIEESGRSIEDVALRMQFSSGSAFRNMLRRYVGMTPQEVGACGGVSFACGVFLAACGTTTCTAKRRQVRRTGDQAA